MNIGPVHFGQHCWGSATGFSQDNAGHLIVLHFTWLFYKRKHIANRLHSKTFAQCTFKCLEESLNKHLCADAAHAEHESEGLQIGMPAVSWTVSLVFESTQHPGPCMGVNSREDELGNACGADAQQQQTEEFSQKVKQHFWQTCFYRIINLLLM